MIIKKLAVEQPYQTRDAPENNNLKLELHCEFEDHIQVLNFMDDLTKMLIIYKENKSNA